MKFTSMFYSKNSRKNDDKLSTTLFASPSDNPSTFQSRHSFIATTDTREPMKKMKADSVRRSKMFASAATLTIVGALSLSACDVPTPPVDGVEQAKIDAKKAQDAAAAQAANQKTQMTEAANSAKAQQTGIVEGGPSAVNASQRLDFLKSKDLMVQYSGLTYNQINDQTAEIVVPANSRVLIEGETVKLSDVPARYRDGQMLPKADLNGLTITILSLSMRTNALVVTVLSDHNLLNDPKAEGTLLLKAPDELKNLCEEGPNVDCSGRNLFGRDWTGKVYDGIIARQANATNLTAAGTSLINCDFSGAQLYRGNFLGANVTGCRFVGIKGQNLMMNSDNTTQSTMTKAVGTDFSKAYLYRCEFDYTDLTNSIWDKADAQNCTFDQATMKGLRASGAWLHRLKASNVDLTGAIAPNVRMSQGTLANSKLDGSNLSGGLLDRIEAKGTSFKNVILTGKGCTMAQAYLDNADLTYLQASGCSFPRASLRNATARGMQIQNADFTFTDLKGADLSHSNAIGVDFFNADTKGMKTEGMQLLGATCPNGDVVGKTSYSKWFRTSKWGGRNSSFVVTNCSWDNPNLSIAGNRIFKSRSVSAGVIQDGIALSDTSSIATPDSSVSSSLSAKS